MLEIGLGYSLIFALTAFLYASIGHGGASGYLAIMAFAGVSSTVMRPTALLLNLIVAALSFSGFFKKGFFKTKLLFPLIATSIPAAFLGASLALPERTYQWVLAVCLLFAVFRILMQTKQSESVTEPNVIYLLGTGLVLGWISGLIGIGGGIILSPIMLIFGWADIKTTAATSAAFIWLNSLSGMIALSLKGLPEIDPYIPWIAASILGGAVGAYLGSHHLNNKTLRVLLAIVLLLASLKLALT